MSLIQILPASCKRTLPVEFYVAFVKVKLRFSAPSAGIAEIEQT